MKTLISLLVLFGWWILTLCLILSIIGAFLVIQESWLERGVKLGKKLLRI